MTKRTKLHTASVKVPSCDVTLIAQCKSSKAELMRRLKADDPIWCRAGVRMSIEPRLANRSFRRGLAIKAVATVDRIRSQS